MSHEIYYTSAPEGLKRGSSGFSTVGATEGIPKALWDRLEALSAYRHHFGVASAEGGGGSGQNPVSYAHWLLSVTGTTYHVLSRICDSGVDHTQRSNAFAHHLVLDVSERAAAGPAWMLEHHGVMESAWNGNVETITRGSGLPPGDWQGGVCQEWASVTGDAGWGGVLADLFVRSPGKPVCILFSPGQDILPLLAETIALLPAAARWNVTFNTYFTSMPTSATCLWRCCLAGTPAAQIGLRYAAGGIVIDLTDRARLGALVEGPYVTMARTGVAPVTAATAATNAGARPAAGKPSVKPTPNAPKIPFPTARYDDEEEDGAYDFADDIQELNEEIDATLPTGSKETPPERGKKRSETSQASQANAPLRVRQLPKTNIRAVESAMRHAEKEASKAAAQRRRQIVWMLFGALAAIAVGTGLVLLAERNSAPPESPSIQRQANSARPLLVPVVPTPPANSVATIGESGVTTAPVQPELVTTQPIPLPLISTAPMILTPVVPEAPRFPAVLTLTTMLMPPRSGGGIADPNQSLPIPPGELDTSSRVTGIRLRFPGAGSDSAGGASVVGNFTQWPYKESFEGTMIEEVGRAASSSGGTGAITLSWKDAAGSMDVATLTFDQSNTRKPVLNVVWKAAALVKRPEVANLAYWLLQSSTVETRRGMGGAELSQQMLFKQVPDQTVDLLAESAPLSFPAEPPRDLVVNTPGAANASKLPAGWEAAWYTDWDEKDATLRTADNATQVVKFHKSTSNGDMEAWFLLRFGPGMKSVGSTFAKGLSHAQQQADDAARTLESTITQVNTLKTQYGANYDSSDTAKELEKKRADAAAQVDAYKEVIAGFGEMNNFQITLGLPGGIRVATITFHRSDKPAIHQGH